MSLYVYGVGRLGQDAEIREINDNTNVLTFSLASDEERRPKEGDQRRTNWYRASVFCKKDSKLGSMLLKGTEVFIKNATWEAETVEREGTTQTYNKLVCNAGDIRVISRPKNGNGNGAPSEDSGGRKF